MWSTKGCSVESHMSSKEPKSSEARGSRLTPLQWYLSSNAVTMLGMGLQQMVSIYILVEMLKTDGVELGFASMLMQMPPLILMLVGGATADRVDPRAILIGTQSAAAVPAIVLAFAAGFDVLGYWLVVSLSVVGGILGSFSGPARMSILNNVSRGGIQRAISLSTGTGSIATVLGYAIFSQVGDIGIEVVLVIQAVTILYGATSIGRLAAMPPEPREGEEPVGFLARTLDMFRTIREGIVACWHERTIGNVILLNFVAGVFNMSAWMVVFPLIIRDFYTTPDFDYGQAFAAVSAAFTVGGIAISFILLRFMPIHRPGRLLMMAQIFRIAIYLVIFVVPAFWALLLITFFWGMNVNLAGTMSRSVVQELAPPSHRASILAVSTVGQMGSATVGAPFLGWMVVEFGTLEAMLPGPVSSLVVFFGALFFTGIWSYVSVQVRQEKDAEPLQENAAD